MLRAEGNNWEFHLKKFKIYKALSWQEFKRLFSMYLTTFTGPKLSISIAENRRKKLIRRTIILILSLL